MAVDMFLKIDGIPGESTDTNHRDEIDVLSYSWGESQPATTGSAGGPAAGRVTMQDFHFTMKINKASPKLFLACASGTHMRSAILTVRRSGGNPVEFLKWTLTDVTVASYQTTTSAAAGESPLDQFSLRFAKIETEYRAVKPDGSLDAPIKAGWDVQANRPI
ncbi:MAG TPA: type VI secretion system tube protein Hcp [Candidatus Binatia bacterium]